VTIRKNKLTYKERKYLRLLAESGFDPKKKMACVKGAGYGKGTTATMIEERPRVRDLLAYEMNRQKLTLEKIVERHVKLLDCTHPVNPKFPKHPKQDDNKIQMQAVVHGYKIHDAYAPTKLSIDKTERHYSVSIEAYRRAEVITGEKIIDVIPEEEEKDDPTIEAL
jgi:hypothetical protein